MGQIRNSIGKSFVLIVVLVLVTTVCSSLVQAKENITEVSKGNILVDGYENAINETSYSPIREDRLGELENSMLQPVDGDQYTNQNKTNTETAEVTENKNMKPGINLCESSTIPSLTLKIPEDQIRGPGTIIVYGYLNYFNRGWVDTQSWAEQVENSDPIQYALVEIWDQDAGFDDLLGTTYTDIDGYFEITVSNDDGEGGGQEIYVTYFAEGDAAWIGPDGIWPVHAPYYAQTNVWPEADDGDWVFMSYNYFYQDLVIKGSPFFIHNTMMDEYLWYEQKTGWHRSQVAVEYPTSESGFHYPADYIVLKASNILPFDDQWSNKTIQHEYGHAINWKLFGNDMPGNSWDIHADHDLYDEFNEYHAFFEGWAQFISSAVDKNATKNYYGAGQTADGTWYFNTLERNHWEKVEENTGLINDDDFDGYLVEGCVASVLWDIYDGSDAIDVWREPPGLPLQQYWESDGEDILNTDDLVDYSPNAENKFEDGLQMGIDEIHDVMITTHPDTIQEFIEGWFTQNYGNAHWIKAICYNHGIKLDWDSGSLSYYPNTAPNTCLFGITESPVNGKYSGTLNLWASSVFDVDVEDWDFMRCRFEYYVDSNANGLADDDPNGDGVDNYKDWILLGETTGAVGSRGSFWDTPTTPDGFYILRAVVDDDMEETESSYEAIEIDNPPTIPNLLLPPDTITINDRTPFFDWEDSIDTGTSVANYEIIIDDDQNFNSIDVQGTPTASSYTPSTDLNDATWYWKVRAKDTNDNWSDWSARWSFTIAATAPSTTHTLGGTLGNNGWYTSSVDVTLAAVPGSVGVQNTFYRIDVGSWQIYTVLFTISGDGIHQLEYYSTDTQGNVEATNSVPVKIDTNAPNLPTLLYPSDGEWVIGMSPYYAWTASDITSELSGTYHIQIAEDSGFTIIEEDSVVPGSITNGAQSTYDPGTTLISGTYYWRMKAQDNAGIWSGFSTANEFYLDSDVVTGTHVYPPYGWAGTTPWINDNQPTFRWTATDGAGSGLSGIYELWVNNFDTGASYINIQVVGSTTNGGETTYSSTVVLPDGEYIWAVYTSDNANNFNVISSPWPHFYVDTVDPVITLASPSDNSITSDTTPEFIWSGLDLSSTISTAFEIEIDNENTFSNPLTYTSSVTGSGINMQPTSHVITSSLTDGIYYWRVHGYDDAGNDAYSGYWTFEIDTQMANPVTNLNANIVTSGGSTHDINYPASNDIDVVGTRVGSFSDTTTQDDSPETITEVTTGGPVYLINTDFETGDDGFYHTFGEGASAITGHTEDSWGRGTPTGSIFGQGPNWAPHSGSKMWETNLAGEYPPSEASGLFSPQITIPAGATNAHLSFWQIYDMSYSNAGTNLKIKIDGGLMQQVDFPEMITYYPNVAGTPDNHPYTHACSESTSEVYNTLVWADMRDGATPWGLWDPDWVYGEVDLSAYIGQQVQLIWHFGSGDTPGTRRGYGLDDVQLWYEMPATSELEHKWLFSGVQPGSQVSFNVDAYRTSNAETDNVIFSYSLDDSAGSYIDMLTITADSDTDAYEQYIFPSGTSGNIYIRAKDTDHTAGNVVLDTLSVDHMNIRSLTESNKDVELTWTLSTSGDVDHYVIYRGISAADVTSLALAAGSPIGTVGNTDTSWIDYGAVYDGIDYHYIVIPVDTGGLLGAWDTIVYIDVNPPIPPGTPTEMSPDVDLVSGPYTVYWPAATDTTSGVQYYELQVSINGGAWTTLKNDIPYSEPYYLISTGIIEGDTHQYRVQAIDYWGNPSGFSSPISDGVTVDMTAPVPIDGISAQISASETDVILTWTDTGVDIHHYIILKATEFGGTYLNVHDTSSDASPLAKTWIDVNAASNTFSYFYKIESIDEAGNNAINNELVASKYSFDLEIGWNLVSIPLIQLNENLPEVLKTVDWSYALYYDASDPADPWKSNNIARPPSLNDLWTLNHKIGFWLLVDGPDDIWEIAGTVPISTTLVLGTGWNMIGFPYFDNDYTVGSFKQMITDQNPGVCVVGMEVGDLSYAYNLRELTDGETMQHGLGYWIKLDDDPSVIIQNIDSDIRCDKSDLFTTPSEPKINESTIIGAKVHNVGNADSPPVTVSFYLDGMLIDRVYISHVPANSFTIASVNWTAIEGSSTIRVVIDYNDNYVDGYICEGFIQLEVWEWNQDPVPIIGVYQIVDIDMRITGRKGNTVTLCVYEDGLLIDEISIIRKSGEQTKTITLKKYLDKEYELILIYNASHKGANPTWLTFSSGENVEKFFIKFNTHNGYNQIVNVDTTYIETVGNYQYYFDASDSYDPDGYIVDYYWDFGDRTSGTGEVVSHTFRKPGTYIVTLFIVDDFGSTSSIEMSIFIPGGLPIPLPSY